MSKKETVKSVFGVLGVIGGILAFGGYITYDAWIIMNAKHQGCPSGQSLEVDLFSVPGITPPYSCGE